MSEDSFTEVTHTSYGGRIKASFKGIIFGLIFFIGAFPLLFWNEGRAVKRYQTLKEGEGAVVSVSPDRVEPSNQGMTRNRGGRLTRARKTAVRCGCETSRPASASKRTGWAGDIHVHRLKAYPP